MEPREPSGVLLITLSGVGHRILQEELYSGDAPEWRSIDEPVAQPDDGLDLAAGGAQLAPEAPDVDVDGARLDQALVAPDPLQQPVARHHPVLVLHQVLEELEFAAGEPHSGAVN